ncbi:MAG: hypothetical protein AB7I18_11905 [Candidatus Berkiella sp.]
MSGMDEFAPFQKRCASFVVRNITSDRQKTIKIFHYPIPYQQTRDLLAIPGVAENDIRASLLKGEIQHKFLAGDIELVHSDIDLLQFNVCEKEWLASLGFNVGLEIDCEQISDEALACIDGYVSGGSVNYRFREEIPLIGLKNNSNRIFYTPDKFINGSYFGNTFHIEIKHDGKALYENIDYTIGESGGPGTGYDTINLIKFSPTVKSTLFAWYAVKV